ncbi:MAG: DnaJ C-terminal domain-containing protein [Clostridium sp.]|nr:DnaJ C-terminal domain-containing protein [Clostridium sp.]
MIFKDYYKILGLESPKATIDDIKTAYREQAKKYHPDVNVGNKNAEERFKDINEAYKTLTNQATKRKYDRMWNAHIGRRKNKAKQNKEQKTTRQELLSVLFGLNTKKEEKDSENSKRKQKTPQQGENVETEIQISVIEGFFGLTKSISLRTVEGKMKTFKVTIPAGIRNGEKIKLMGQGRPGKNGGKNGDLLIKINMSEDKKYKLVGSDIYTTVNICPWEAVLGTKINVDAIDETIGVFIPQGIQTDEEIQIPDKGYRDSKGGRGKFIIRVRIMISKNISEKEKELYKEIKKISKFNPRDI